MKHLLRLTLLSFLLTTLPAYATAPSPVFSNGTFAPANMVQPMTQSGKEALLISFYRNSGRTPDFKRWSFLTKTVTEAADYDKPVIALNEQVRLQTAFQNTDPSEYLVIHAPIDVSQYSAAQETLFLPIFNSMGTLTQEIYGEKMAIVVKDLTRFQKIAMTDAEASGFYNALTEIGKNKVSIPAFVELVVKPKRTIFSKEGRVGKGDHYLFFVDLAQITIWRKDVDKEDTKPLWTWKADWYKTKDDNAELLQLYKAIN